MRGPHLATSGAGPRRRRLPDSSDDFRRLSSVDAHAFDGADSRNPADRWLDV